MSTRSFIVIEDSPSNYRGIYCHSDGYLSWVGFMLYCFYDTKKKVDELINLGDLSALGVRIGTKLDWNKRMMDIDYYEKVKSQCCSYYRDREEKDATLRRTSDLNEFCAEYVYLFKNGEWYVKESKRFLGLKLKLQHDKDITKNLQNTFYHFCNSDDELHQYATKLIELGICKLDIINNDVRYKTNRVKNNTLNIYDRIKGKNDENKKSNNSKMKIIQKLDKDLYLVNYRNMNVNMTIQEIVTNIMNNGFALSNISSIKNELMSYKGK